MPITGERHLAAVLGSYAAHDTRIGRIARWANGPPRRSDITDVVTAKVDVVPSAAG